MRFNLHHTVDQILVDFNKIIQRLDAAESQAVKQRDFKQALISNLEADVKGHNVEAERAAAVRAKLQKLIA